MSSNSNNIINLTNYEEFFILYMDGELTTVEMNMVDAFLDNHPELKGEFDLLLSTKLPEEELTFDKSLLLSGMMKKEAIDETLLLYVDDELSGEEKNSFEKKLAVTPEYHLPYQQLLKTKLDPSEVVSYPDKTELYRHSEKVVFFKPWMRIAAAALIIAMAGWMYYQSVKPSVGAVEPIVVKNTKSGERKAESGGEKENGKENVQISNEVAVEPVRYKTVVPYIQYQKLDKNKQTTLPVLDQDSQNEQDEQLVARNIVRTPAIVTENHLADVVELPSSKIINRQSVTNSSDVRNTDITAATQQNAVAKGSVKGFLRRATKLIEKRTGIDPTNDGELLIGALALNLK